MFVLQLPAVAVPKAQVTAIEGDVQRIATCFR